MSKKIRLYVIIGAAAAVLLATGIVVAVNLFTDKVDNAIPQADLFGPTTPPYGNLSPLAAAQPDPAAGGGHRRPAQHPHRGRGHPRGRAVVAAQGRRGHDHARQQGPVQRLPDLAARATCWSTSRRTRPSHFGGERSKLTHAMAFGSVVPGSCLPNPAQGFPLLAQAVSRYTGIDHFDAGAVITFNGMRALVNAIGGIDMYIDEQTASIHLQPDASGLLACGSCPNGVTGPPDDLQRGHHHAPGRLAGAGLRPAALHARRGLLAAAPPAPDDQGHHEEDHLGRVPGRARAASWT